MRLKSVLAAVIAVAVLGVGARAEAALVTLTPIGNPAWQPVDASLFTATGGIRKCGEIGWPIGDMDSVEQAVPEQPRHRCTQHHLGRGRNELHFAVAAMPRNHVAHIARQQPISIFFDIEQRYAGARERLRAECQSRGVERRRRDAECHTDAA